MAGRRTRNNLDKQNSLSTIQNEFSVLEEQLLSQIGFCQHIASGVKHRGLNMDQFASDIANAFKETLKQEFSKLYAQTKLPSNFASVKEQFEETKEQIHFVSAEKKTNLDTHIASLQDEVESLPLFNEQQTQNEIRSLKTLVSKLENELKMEEEKNKQCLKMLQNLEMNHNTTTITSGDNINTLTSASSPEESAVANEIMENEIMELQKEYKRLSNMLELENEASIEMQNELLADIEIEKEKLTQAKLLNKSQQDAKRKKYRSLKRSPTLDRLEHQVGNLIKEIASEGGDKNVPLSVEKEKFDMQSIQKEQEITMFEHVKSEQGKLMKELEELDNQIQIEKENFKKRKEKSIKQIENTKLDLEANRAEIGEMRIELGERLKEIADNSENPENEASEFFALKKEKNAELQKFKNSMLEEMDSLDKLQDQLEQKRMALEESKEALERERHKLMDEAEAELAEERNKINEENLRVKSLAAELQSAMDKITKKKKPKTPSASTDKSEPPTYEEATSTVSSTMSENLEAVEGNTAKSPNKKIISTSPKPSVPKGKAKENSVSGKKSATNSTKKSSSRRSSGSSSVKKNEKNSTKSSQKAKPIAQKVSSSASRRAAKKRAKDPGKQPNTSFLFQKFDKQELHELEINGFSELCESENVKCTETRDGWHIKGSTDGVLNVKEEVAKILTVGFKRGVRSRTRSDAVCTRRSLRRSHSATRLRRKTQTLASSRKVVKASTTRAKPLSPRSISLRDSSSNSSEFKSSGAGKKEQNNCTESDEKNKKKNVEIKSSENAESLTTMEQGNDGDSISSLSSKRLNSVEATKV